MDTNDSVRSILSSLWTSLLSWGNLQHPTRKHFKRNQTMNTHVSIFGNTPPADIGKMNEALAGLARGVQSSNTHTLLRLRKQDGEWVCGQNDEHLPRGTELIVDPFSFESGYIAWLDGKPEGKVTQALYLGPVKLDQLSPVKSKKGWESILSVALATVDEPRMQLLYETGSVAGTRALGQLAGAVAWGRDADPHNHYPVVGISADSYKHAEFGTIWTPVFAVMRWLDVDGAPVAERKSLA